MRETRSGRWQLSCQSGRHYVNNWLSETPIVAFPQVARLPYPH